MARFLPLCLWSLYVWNLATPGLRDRNGNLKGTDFLHLYTLGSLAGRSSRCRLVRHECAGRAGRCSACRKPRAFDTCLSIRRRFRFCSRRSRISPTAGRWFCGGVAARLVYGICCYVIWRACPNLRDYGGTVILLAAAFPAFFHLIAWGQTSALALACFTLMFFCCATGANFLPAWRSAV